MENAGQDKKLYKTEQSLGFQKRLETLRNKIEI